MTGLQYLSLEVFVIGNIQFTLVVQEAIIFFPFKDTRGEASGSLLLDSLKSLSDFAFAFHTFAYA
ncbi:hypothetical protein ACO1LA_14480, partial [Staphylococcus aureus]